MPNASAEQLTDAASSVLFHVRTSRRWMNHALVVDDEPLLLIQTKVHYLERPTPGTHDEERQMRIAKALQEPRF